MFPKCIHFYTENASFGVMLALFIIVYIDIAKLQMRFLHYAFFS